MGGISELLGKLTPGRVQTGVVKAVWRGTVLAESDSTVRLEGNHYFPPESLRADYLKPSDHKTLCPWKGVASYFTVEVDGDRSEAAAWYYPKPSPPAAKIRDHVAFGAGVDIVPG